MPPRENAGPASSPSARAALLALPPLLLALLVFYPITGNYFYGDDLLNPYQIVNDGIARYVLSPKAGHILVLRNAVFALCFQLFGTAPLPYFALALLVHLANVYLLFRVVRVFTGSALLACFGAALWGASRVNEGTLGWLSVHGQALVASVALWLLLQLGRIANGAAVRRGAPLRWALLALAMSTLFGTGTGLAVAFPVAAFALLPASPARAAVLRALGGAALAVPLLYVGLHWLARALNAASSLASPQVHLGLWPTILSLFGQQLASGVAGLPLGEFLTRTGYPQPAAGLALAAAAVVLLVAALVGSAATRRQLGAFLLLAFVTYALVALGRAYFVAAGMNPNLVVHSARYHYLGPLFLTLALCSALAALSARAPAARRLAAPGLAAWLTVATGLHLWRARPIDHHAFARAQTAAALQKIRADIAATPPGQNVYIPLPDEPFHGVGPMLARNRGRFPGWAGVFTIFFPSNVVDGRRVYFVTADPALLAATAGGRRTADLFVTPERAGAPAQKAK